MQHASLKLIPLGLSLTLSLPLMGAETPFGATQSTEISLIGQVVDAFHFDGGNDISYSIGGGITSYNVLTDVGSSVGSAPAPKNGFATLVKNGSGDYFFADGTSFSSPFPHELGRLSGTTYTLQGVGNGIYDYAIDPSTGNMFVSADTGGGNNSLFQYDYATGALTEFFSTGGNSGGIAFDANGDLFYGSNLDSTIYQIDGSLLASAPISPLSLTEPGVSIFTTNINGSRLTVGDDGTVVVTAFLADFSGSNLWVYNSDGSRRGLAARTGSFNYLGEIYWNDDSVFVAETDFFSYSNILEIGNLSNVPEPAAFPALAGVLALLAARRRA